MYRMTLFYIYMDRLFQSFRNLNSFALFCHNCICKMLSDTSWAAIGATLLELYRSLVWSNLNYGCIIYGSAKHHIYNCLILYIIMDLVKL